MDLPDSDQGAQ